jgi:uncharacterized protein YPO0396
MTSRTLNGVDVHSSLIRQVIEDIQGLLRGLALLLHAKDQIDPLVKMLQSKYERDRKQRAPKQEANKR